MVSLLFDGVDFLLPLTLRLIVQALADSQFRGPSETSGLLPLPLRDALHFLSIQPALARMRDDRRTPIPLTGEGTLLVIRPSLRNDMPAQSRTRLAQQQSRPTCNGITFAVAGVSHALCSVTKSQSRRESSCSNAY